MVNCLHSNAMDEECLCSLGASRHLRSQPSPGPDSTAGAGVHAGGEDAEPRDAEGNGGEGDGLSYEPTSRFVIPPSIVTSRGRTRMDTCMMSTTDTGTDEPPFDRLLAPVLP